LQYLSQIDLNLSAENREFIEYVIVKWNLKLKNSAGNVLSLKQTDLSVQKRIQWFVAGGVTGC
jgi:hypothetical protein